MKSRAKFDWYMYVLLTIPVVTTILLVWFKEKTFELDSLLLIGLVLGLVLLSSVNSYYKIEDEYLLIKLGAMRRRVPYTDIQSCHKGSSSFIAKTSFSHKGIIVNLYPYHSHAETFVIGPKDVDGFYDQLQIKILR